MPTVKDVAQLAGVSTATVSRTLSNPDKVQEATRIKVMSAAKKIGYAPNAMARSLRRQESKTILVILADIGNSFYSRVIHGIEDIAHREGYKILLGDAGYDPVRALSYMELYDSKQVDGILLLTSEIAREVFENEARMKSLQVVMACEYIEDADWPLVMVNNREGAQHAVEYLVSLGHTKIATVMGPTFTPICNDRHQGYLDAMTKNSLELNSSYLIEGDFTFQAGVNAGLQLMQLEDRPTAVFCQNDVMAIGLMSSVREQGFNVPEDISVVGFDDIEFSEYCEPALTTVHQPREQIGEQAMKLLMDRLGHKKAIVNQTLPTQFIVRKSAGRPTIKSNS